jgi:flagellar protein FliS
MKPAYHAADKYREMDVAAMNPSQLIVALYARLLLSLKQARFAIDQGNIVGREERLDLATAILHELAVSLEHDVNPAMSGSLASLYAWLISECHAVHAQPVATRLDAPIRIVQELHEAWVEVARQSAQPAMVP